MQTRQRFTRDWDWLVQIWRKFTRDLQELVQIHVGSPRVIYESSWYFRTAMLVHRKAREAHASKIYSLVTDHSFIRLECSRLLIY